VKNIPGVGLHKGLIFGISHWLWLFVLSSSALPHNLRNWTKLKRSSSSSLSSPSLSNFLINHLTYCKWNTKNATDQIYCKNKKIALCVFYLILHALLLANILYNMCTKNEANAQFCLYLSNSLTDPDNTGIHRQQFMTLTLMIKQYCVTITEYGRPLWTHRVTYNAL